MIFSKNSYVPMIENELLTRIEAQLKTLEGLRDTLKSNLHCDDGCAITPESPSVSEGSEEDIVRQHQPQQQQKQQITTQFQSDPLQISVGRLKRAADAEKMYQKMLKQTDPSTSNQKREQRRQAAINTIKEKEQVISLKKEHLEQLREESFRNDEMRKREAMLQKSKAAKAVRDSIQQELQKQKNEEQNIRSALRHAADTRRSEFQNDEKRREREKMLLNHLEFRRRLENAEREESKKTRRASADIRPTTETRSSSVTRSQSDGAIKRTVPIPPPPPPPQTDIQLGSSISQKDSSNKGRKKVSFESDPKTAFATPPKTMAKSPETPPVLSTVEEVHETLGNLKNEPQKLQTLPTHESDNNTVHVEESIPVHLKTIAETTVTAPSSKIAAEIPVVRQQEPTREELGSLKNEPQKLSASPAPIKPSSIDQSADDDNATDDKIQISSSDHNTTQQTISGLAPREPPKQQNSLVDDKVDRSAKQLERTLVSEAPPATSTIDVTVGNNQPMRGHYEREEIVKEPTAGKVHETEFVNIPVWQEQKVDTPQPKVLKKQSVHVGGKVVCELDPPVVQESNLLSSPKNENTLRRQLEEVIIEEVTVSPVDNPLSVPAGDSSPKVVNSRHPIPPKQSSIPANRSCSPDDFIARFGSNQSRTRFRILKEKDREVMSPPRASETNSSSPKGPVGQTVKQKLSTAAAESQSPTSSQKVAEETNSASYKVNTSSPKGKSAWQPRPVGNISSTKKSDNSSPKNLRKTTTPVDVTKQSTSETVLTKKPTKDYVANPFVEALRKTRGCCLKGCVSGALVVAVIAAVSKPKSQPDQVPPPLMKDGSVASLRQVISDNQSADRHEKNISKLFRSRQQPMPSPSESATRLREAANTQYKAGKFTEAVKGYTQAIVCTPDNALLYMNRSAAYMALGLFQDALNDASYASKLENDNPKVFFRMAKLNLLTGNPVAARLLYSTARKLAIAASATDLLEASQNEAKALELIESSLRHREHHRWRQALASIEQALGFLPCLFFQQLRCEALIMVDPRKAAEDLRTLAAAHQTVADIHYLYAKAVFYSSHDKIGTNTALQELGVALSIDNSHPKARSLHLVISSFEKYRDDGNVAFEQRRWKVAHSAYTKALALDPNNYLLKSTILLNRAAVQFQQGFTDSAKEDCTASILFDDTNYKAYVKRAKCHMQLDNCTQAVKDLKLAYKINPSAEILTKLKQAEDLITRKYGAGTEFYCRGRGNSSQNGSPRASKPEPKKQSSGIPKRRTAFKAFNTSAASEGDADGGGSSFRKTANGFDFKKFTKSDPNDFFFEFKNSRTRPFPKTSRPSSAAPKQAAPVSKSLYDTLGVPRTATAAVIKSTYHKEALRWHPDKWITATKEESLKAEIRFKDVSQAYATLSDPAKRKGYDLAKTV